MAQTQAIYQAFQAERLLASREYQDKLGSAEANLWVARQSLEGNPADIRPSLLELQQKRWSFDSLRFWGEERPAVIDVSSGGGNLQ